MGSYPVNNTEVTLKLIRESIEKELRFKQDLINRQQLEIDRLRKHEEEHTEIIKERDLRLQNLAAQNDGNKQLLNKLLGDISKMQNDLDWYKRTYEQRSTLGYFREKFFKKRQ